MIKAKTEISNRPAGEFSFTKENNKILKGLIETLASLIDECQLILTPDDLIIKAMDPSKICVMFLKMHTDAFELYNAKKCSVGINLDDFDKILKRCNAKDKLEISYKTEEKKIKVKMTRSNSEAEAESVSNRARTFSLAEIEIDTEDVPLDNLINNEYASTWTIDPVILVEAIKDAEIYSEILTIKAEKEKGVLFNSSGQIGELTYELGPEEFLTFETNKTATGSYSLTFLRNIFKLVPIVDKLEVSLHTDYPLKLEFNISEGGTLLIFLAPRVEEAEFEEEEDMDFEKSKKKKVAEPNKEPKPEPETESDEPEEPEVDEI